MLLCDFLIFKGFGEMTSRLLAKKGYKVVSACLTEEGEQRLKNTVSPWQSFSLARCSMACCLVFCFEGGFDCPV